MYKRTKKNHLQNFNFIPIDEIDIVDNKTLEENYIKNDTKLTLYKALQNLDDTTREVMYLRLTGDLTFKEIGNILNKTENWAKVTYFRGKEKLKKGDFI